VFWRGCEAFKKAEERGLADGGWIEWFAHLEDRAKLKPERSPAEGDRRGFPPTPMNLVRWVLSREAGMRCRGLPLPCLF